MRIEASRPRPSFLGIDFDCGTYEHVARVIDQLSRGDKFTYIVTPNVDHLLMLHPREASAVSDRFQHAYDAARLTLCDSRIVQRLARLHGVTLDLITGSDLTAYLFDTGHLSGRKVAIIGGDTDMVPELNTRYPGIDIVQHQPPMGVLKSQDATADIIRFIEQERAHFVLFAIGAPQSEIIAHQCRVAGKSVGVGLCIGASIEFILGRKQRAPFWMQRLSLEWAFRLYQEPARLWRRYLLTGPRIFWLAVRRPKAR